MKRILIIGLGLAFMFACMSMGASSVAPATATFNCQRGESVTSVAAGTIYRGQSLTFTNCVLYSDTEGLVVQHLSNVTVTVSCGNLSTNIDYTATVTSAALGKWHRTVVVPDLASWTVQVKIVDASTNTYIYPGKVFASEESMF